MRISDWSSDVCSSDLLWAVQGRVLGIYGGFMKHWCERRQEAARSAIEMTQKAMHADGQPVNLPALYGEWVSHSMQRLAADLQECQECGSEIAACCGSPIRHREIGRAHV